MKNNITLFLIAFISINQLQSQSLLDKLNKEYKNTPQHQTATFKGTRLAIGHSIENRKQGVLQLQFINRYWNLPNNETAQSFIADRWTARLGADYAITDNLTLGAGWSTLENIYDGYAKYNLLRQSINNKSKFLSLTLVQGFAYNHKDLPILNNFSNRWTYNSQLLIARKFTPEFSLQIAPTYIHSTYANQQDPKNYFALGFGGRYKVKKHVSLVAEYYHNSNKLRSKDTYGAFALGVNWDVRYLLLQFQMTNARTYSEHSYIVNTPKNFNSQDGNFVFGFNAIFTIHTKDELK
ncbi:DUF5777 family beta-barrel protein [Wenyingzhuangia sp. IMCC45574]